MISEKLYNLLKKVAKKEIGNGGTIFYSELAILAGEPFFDVDERNKFFELLGEITEHEVKIRERPMISVVVVHKNEKNNSRICGDGFFELAIDLKRWDGKGDKSNFFIKELKEVHNTWVNINE